jgi:solute carrier family 25 carnitine/acylcarnitine transporter 20/29
LQAQSALATASVATLGVTGVAASIKHNGPIDVAKHVLRYDGARGLFKGLIPTLSRDVPGNAIAFGVYEALKQFMAGGPDTSQLGMGALLTSGGIAGAVCWALIYPTDVVKSVIQIDESHQPKYSGTIDAFKKLATSEGFKGLYKGFGPALARSVPGNAACFLAYEVTRSILG